MVTKKISIAGAGPAGLTAAINLAKAGLPVEVFEKRSNVGKHFQGNLQGLENWSEATNVIAELRRMNLAINFDAHPFRRQTITNGVKSRASTYPAHKPLCYLIKRGVVPGSLDEGLKAQALAAGVDIHFNQTIPLAEARIIATGPIAKETFAVEKGIIFNTAYKDTNIALVNDEAAYKGYSYLLITKGYGCLCTVLFDKFERLDDCFQVTKKIFAQSHPFDIHDPRPVAGVGSFSSKNIYRQGRSLLVGEAAGLQDLMWGFGIRTAVKSGYLAAQCLIHGTDYAAAAKAYFGPRQKATLTGRFLWELARINNYAFIVRENTNTVVKTTFDLSFFYKFGKLNRILYPIAVRYMRRRYPRLRI